MKTIVSIQDVIELEVKPEALLQEYQAIATRELATRAQGWRFRPIACPGCSSGESRPAFVKMGLSYRECAKCRSLFVSPRPADAELLDFHRSSAAAKFWRERVLGATGDARAVKLHAPRAQWVLDRLAETSPGPWRGADMSAHGRGFVEALVASDDVANLAALHPMADLDLAGTKSAKLRIAPGKLGDARGLDFVTSFDALDRAPDPDALIGACAEALRPGGLLLLGAPSATGFDVQVLWDQARSIAPPEKLNVLSVEGLEVLLARHRLQVVEFSTPGMFDAEAVQRALSHDPKAPWPRFLRTLVERGPETLAAFQEFLQSQRLSSFARIAARKAGP